MSPTKLHTGQLIKAVFIVLLPFEIIFVNWTVNHPEWVETYYSNWFYPFIQSLLSTLSGLIPVPIGQIVFYTLLLGLVIWSVNRIVEVVKKKISIKRFIWVVVKNGLFCFFTIYFPVQPDLGT